MQNRRLIYISTNSSLSNLASLMSTIDAYLLESKYLSPLNSNFYFYGKVQDQQEIWCGREIAGREEEVYSHPTIRVTDFNAGEFEEIKIQANDFQDLFVQISNVETAYVEFRVLFSLDRPHDFSVFLF